MASQHIDRGRVHWDVAMTSGVVASNSGRTSDRRNREMPFAANEAK